jgi:ABC-type multidrug transport system ATPase subunit
MLAGLVRPDSGDVSRAPGTRVGFASHHTFLYSKLSVQENIRLYAALVRGDAHEHEELLTRWNVSNVAQTPIHQLSKGTQAKVSLIRALLGKPHILLLDEPSSNLDEQSVAVLLQEVRSQQARGVCIIATHDVARLRQIATRVIVLEKGAIVADSGPNASEQQRDQVVETYYQGNR